MKNTPIKILIAQMGTNLEQVSKDYIAGLYDASGLVKDLKTLLEKALVIEAQEDAINDIRENDPEQRAERQAEEVEQRRDAYREECDCHASPEDGCEHCKEQL